MTLNRILMNTVRDRRQWAHRLHTEISEHYSARPIEELLRTTSEVAEAKYAMLCMGLLKNRFDIEMISKLRLEVLFSLSEVQNAFELYRSILVPILFRKLDRSLLPYFHPKAEYLSELCHQ